MNPSHSPELERQQSTDPETLLAFLNDKDLGLGAKQRTLVKAQRVEISSAAASPIFVVFRGQLQVYVPTRQGTDVFVTDVEDGEMVGESAAFAEHDTPLLIEASKPTEVYVINRGHFIRAMTESSAFSIAVMRAMCRRLCRVNQRLATTVARSMRERLEIELRRLAKPMPDGSMQIDRLLTHEELALRISSQREAVTKELSRLVQRGVISRDRRGLRILRFDQLADAETS